LYIYLIHIPKVKISNLFYLKNMIMNNNADNIINIKSHFIFRAEFDKYFCLLFKPIYIPIRRSKKIFNIYKKTYVLINYLQIYNCGDMLYGN